MWYFGHSENTRNRKKVVYSLKNVLILKGSGQSAACEIEGYYDTDKRVVYLHLKSALDTTTLVSLCLEASKDLDSVVSQCYHIIIGSRLVRVDNRSKG